MKVLGYILVFVAGGLSVYLWGKSKSATEIKRDHEAMVITVTLQSKEALDAHKALIEEKNRVIAVLEKQNVDASDKIKSLIESENKLQNEILYFEGFLSELQNVVYFDDVDSAAIWIISELRSHGHRATITDGL